MSGSFVSVRAKLTIDQESKKKKSNYSKKNFGKICGVASLGKFVAQPFYATVTRYRVDDTTVLELRKGARAVPNIGSKIVGRLTGSD